MPKPKGTTDCIFPNLLPVSPDTVAGVNEILSAHGGRPGVLLDNDKSSSGSPFLWYGSGWKALDQIEARSPDLIRVGIQKLDSALVLRVSQRHDNWTSVIPYNQIDRIQWLDRSTGAERDSREDSLTSMIMSAMKSAFQREDAEDKVLLAGNGVELTLRVPGMHRRRTESYIHGLRIAG